ncbi:hydrogenase maturation protease [Jeotgalibacillus haloalkalitolerans]|uniref:Hydrogenase maturation protease n=1 Tax=Jeotgalibacillus haloalkalitolerans TaxID=3104292 RepID=A0ABU5KNA7_9BACL|nr:hydrogenase maturation protease [Jeotgalibacillus sp. HH7-29]MDZ5712746.1 hydrogenase maturation protease [Jeotgalibacillus sp. HH7-29]
MEKVIVLGIGNRLMMDDGIGIYVVEALAENHKDDQVQYLIGESDVDYCLEQIHGADTVIIVDAVFNNKKAGEVSIIPLEELREQQSLDISPHNIHLFNALYQQKDEVKGYLIAIEPSVIHFHIGLSKVLDGKWEQIKAEVEQKINLLKVETEG